ncbi:transglutaminase-like domain-containing protein [Fodinibius sediminis]|uniref:Transglutaminase-like superfamily protein n=1 Tax=Fodinibius sediminis TaxID=1214077 RepID=A0A521AML4_9BACT|nr:transglutaminase-like domain-containing protein [Fodinibius sediminis]SMO36047.1 Transglutaminase-like superfamily protein [Fodinibius sediminis]
MPEKKEIESLVYLLDDPDPYVQSEVKKRLFELGDNAVPLLDQRKNEINDEKERALISEIIQWITYSSVEEDFLDVLGNGLNDLEQLEKAIFILARFDNPTLRASEYRQQLDRYAERIAADVQYSLSETQKMHKVLDLVFTDLEFSGSMTDYYNPKNSFLNQVMDRRKGLPISLGLIVLFIARRLDLPFRGINMPIHFMLMYKAEQEKILIDPFDHGKIVTYNQCFYFLEQNGVTPKSEHFQPSSEPVILARCIRNLISSYEKKDLSHKTEGLSHLLQTVEMMTHL